MSKMALFHLAIAMNIVPAPELFFFLDSLFAYQTEKSWNIILTFVLLNSTRLGDS